MAKPAPQDITVVRGDDFYMYLGVKRSGARIDLTGATVTGQCRTTADDAAVAGTFVCTLTDQVADIGGILCKLPKADTGGMNAATYVYDIQIDFANGDRTTVVAGKVTMVKDVTHA